MSASFGGAHFHNNCRLLRALRRNPVARRRFDRREAQGWRHSAHGFPGGRLVAVVRTENAEGRHSHGRDGDRKE